MRKPEVPVPRRCIPLPRDRTASTLMILVNDERNLTPKRWVEHAQLVRGYLDERLALYDVNSCP